MRFLFWLYKLVQPLYQKLEAAVQEEIRRDEQAKQYALAEELHKKFLEKHPRSDAHGGYLEVKRVDPKDCEHLKGGRRGKRGPFGHKDYSVYPFTFPDGHTEIRCQICGRIWIEGNSDWQEALEMASQSSNSAGSSEVLFQKNPLPGWTAKTVAV